jgi:hypothetical protein
VGSLHKAFFGFVALAADCSHVPSGGCRPSRPILSGEELARAEVNAASSVAAGLAKDCAHPLCRHVLPEPFDGSWGDKSK